MPRIKETRNPLGSIFKREVIKNGKKIVVYDVRKRFAATDKAGRKIYKAKSKRCYTYAEALIVLGNLPAEIEAEKTETPSATETTFFQLVEYFRTEYVKPAVYSSGEKIGGYRQDIKVLKSYLDQFKEFFGDIPLTALNYERLRAFREYLAGQHTRYKRPPTVSTLNKKLSFLNRVLNVGIQSDALLVNPFSRGKSLISKSKATTRNRMMSFDEERRLLAQCTNGRAHLRFFIIAAVDTTMRRGEIFDLKWRQVDFKRNVIYLTEEAAKETKTGVEGILPMTSRFKTELLLLIENRGGDIKPGNLVVGKIEFKRSWKSVCKDAGVKNLQFRDLRSTGATRLMLAGVSGDLARKATRHTRIETFHEHYTNVDRDIARDMGLKLDQLHRQNSGRKKRKPTSKAKVKAKAKSKAKDG